jgi:hypothetical protein
MMVPGSASALRQGGGGGQGMQVPSLPSLAPSTLHGPVLAAYLALIAMEYMIAYVHAPRINGGMNFTTRRCALCPVKLSVHL